MNITKERAKELREWLIHDFGEFSRVQDHDCDCDSCQNARAVLALLDAHEGPTSGEREALAKTFDVICAVARGNPVADPESLFDAQSHIRSLILSGPAPRVVSREWVVGVFDDLEDYHGEPAYEYLERRLRSIGIEVSE